MQGAGVPCILPPDPGAAVDLGGRNSYYVQKTKKKIPKHVSITAWDPKYLHLHSVLELITWTPSVLCPAHSGVGRSLDGAPH